MGVVIGAFNNGYFTTSAVQNDFTNVAGLRIHSDRHGRLIAVTANLLTESYRSVAESYLLAGQHSAS